MICQSCGTQHRADAKYCMNCGGTLSEPARSSTERRVQPAGGNRGRRAGNEWRRAEERYRSLYEHAKDIIYTVSPTGAITSLNPVFEDITGWPRDEWLGKPFGSLVHPDDLPMVTDTLEQAIRGEDTPSGEVRIISRTGEWLTLDVRIMAGRTAAYSGCVLGIARDVTARKKAEALMAGQKSILELIARRAPLAAVLHALVALIEQQSPGMLASILLLDDLGGHLYHGAAPSLPRPYCEAIDGVRIGPHVGSCGTAAHRGETVIVSDIAADPLWSDFRDLALRHGLRACWSTPIKSSARQVLGTFAMYYREPRSPSAHDLQLIDVAAHLAGIAIEGARTEERLYEARQMEGRLEGIILAAREVGHLLNNDLQVPVGVLDLLEEDPAVPAHLRRLVGDAAEALAAARQHLAQFQRVVRVETKDTPVGPALDLERSTRAVAS